MTGTRIDRPPAGIRKFSSQSALPPAFNDSALELTRIVATSNNKSQLHGGLVSWLQNRPGIAAAGVFHSESAGAVTLGPNSFDGPVFEKESFQNNAAEAATFVCETGTAQTRPVSNVRNLLVVSVPIQTGERAFDSLTAGLIVSGDQPNCSDLSIAAAHASLWHANQKTITAEKNLSLTAATLDLLNTIESAENFRNGCISAVNALRSHLGCRGVVLGMVRRIGRRCRLSAMSGMADFDANSLITRQIEEVLDECIVRNRLSVFPPDDNSDRDSLLAHQRLCSDVQAKRIVSHPLIDANGETIGAWLAIDDAESKCGEEVSTLLRAAAPRMATTLQLARRVDSGLLGSRKKRKSSLRWLIRGLFTSAIITLVLMIPVPYQIHCECAAEPEVRRFIVAPHQGLIEKTFVEPGDVVSAGMLLARMDGRDLRWELAGLAAEYERATKDQDSRLLSGDVAASKRAELELKQLEARREILMRQRNELELTSPVDGIVLDGQLERVENAPVTIGQALYEIAPLSPVAIEVAIPDDEFPNVAAGLEVTVRFDGIEDEFTGTIEHIHPRSEVRDGDNVFIADVLLENDDEQLRPGMKGYARVKGQTHSIGWNLFHKPWEHFQKSLPF